MTDSYERDTASTAPHGAQAVEDLHRLAQRFDSLESKFDEMMALWRSAEKSDEESETDSEEVIQATPSDEYIDLDIQKAVQKFFKTTPVDLGGAHRKIRVCIENYCRYKKGVDLSDRIFFDGQSVEAKLAEADVDHAILKPLAEIYRRTNGFVHDSLACISMTEEEIRQEVASIDESARRLHEWGIDDVDLEFGVPFLYTNRDKRLLRLLNEEGEQVDRISDKLLGFYCDNTRGLEAFMKKQQIKIPEIMFKESQDVYDYLLGKKMQRGGVGALSDADRARVFSLYEKRAQEGDFDACLWLGERYRVTNNLQRAVEYYLLADRTPNADERRGKTSTEIKCRVGETLCRAKEYMAAIKWIDSIENQVNALILAGDCFYLANQPQEALDRYCKVFPSMLTGDRRKLFVADALFADNPQRAKEYYQKCTTAQTDPEIIKKIGDCCLESDDVGGALSYYEKLLDTQYPLSLGQQLVEIFENRITCTQVVCASASQERKIVGKIADLLWSFDRKALACNWYNRCPIWWIVESRQKEIGNYYLANQEVGLAAMWYSYYVKTSSDFRFAEDAAWHFKMHGEHAAAVTMYESFAWKIKNADTIKYVAEHCLSDKKFSRAIVWYEKYYECGEKPDESVARLLIQLHENHGKASDAVQWKRKLADLLFDRGEVDEAAKLYREFVSSDEIGLVAMRLAEYYYFRGMHRDALEMLALNAKDEVMLCSNFALSKNGVLFIAYGERLLPVRAWMVDRIKFKGSKKVSVVLYLNRQAHKVLPTVISLVDGLDAKDEALQILKQYFPTKRKKKTNWKKKTTTSSRKVERKKRRINISINMPLRICLSVVACLIGLFAMIYNEEVGYYYADTAYYVQVVLIGVLAMAANMGIARIQEEKVSLAQTLLAWGAWLAQYATHLVYVAQFWLDINDGEIYFGEFFAEGVLPTIIAGVICFVLYAWARGDE